MSTAWPFELDRFQLEAIRAIDGGRSVLVAAPTSSGKTVVAEHAVDRALASGRRAFYTAPIKALSNQKFRDLGRRLGPGQVGLLTGDNTILSEAPVVVMTTEVLRNMLYAGSTAIDDLAWVVLDEVHFLEDPYRGAVWEEVILNLPPQIGIVALSATVSNSEELGAWLNAVRGPTDVVVERRRPVPLRSHYLVVERRRERMLRRLPVLVKGAPNSEGSRYDIEGRLRRGRNGPGWATPRRDEVLRDLRQEKLLPASHFIFSRAGCDEARDGLLRAGMNLNDGRESAEVDVRVDRRLAGVPVGDLEALDVYRWREGLRRGIAAHHAGLLPLFKEITEDLFAAGLLKIVYATDTLALGVNLPARSVVIDKLTKFTGESHEGLTAGQFAQLTGRAGRRGIDVEGHARVCWSPFVRFGQVAGLAMSRDFVLRSAFRPTYNMLANLISTRTREEALDLLARSFGQFQADRLHAEHGERLAAMRAEAAELRAGPGGGAREGSRSDGQRRLEGLERRIGWAEQRTPDTDLVSRMTDMEHVLAVRGLASGWSLTERGVPLTRIYNEAELLVVEALSEGLFDDLEPAGLAAGVSALTYRRRGPGDTPTIVGGGVPGRRLDDLAALADDLATLESSVGLPVPSPPDPGIADMIAGWVEGGSLGAVLDGVLTGGDFVRNVRLVSDLLGQLRKVAPAQVGLAAARAITGLERGVVALSGAVSETSDDDGGGEVGRAV